MTVTSETSGGCVSTRVRIRRFSRSKMQRIFTSFAQFFNTKRICQILFVLWWFLSSRQWKQSRLILAEWRRKKYIILLKILTEECLRLVKKLTSRCSHLSLSLLQYSTRGWCSLFLWGIGSLWIGINPTALFEPELLLLLSLFESFVYSQFLWIHFACSIRASSKIKQNVFFEINSSPSKLFS